MGHSGLQAHQAGADACQQEGGAGRAGVLPAVPAAGGRGAGPRAEPGAAGADGARAGDGARAQAVGAGAGGRGAGGAAAALGAGAAPGAGRAAGAPEPALRAARGGATAQQAVRAAPQAPQAAQLCARREAQKEGVLRMFRRGTLTSFHMFVRLRQGADLRVKWSYRLREVWT